MRDSQTLSIAHTNLFSTIVRLSLETEVVQICSEMICRTSARIPIAIRWCVLCGEKGNRWTRVVVRLEWLVETVPTWVHSVTKFIVEIVDKSGTIREVCWWLATTPNSSTTSRICRRVPVVVWKGMMLLMLRMWRGMPWFEVVGCGTLWCCTILICKVCRWVVEIQRFHMLLQSKLLGDKMSIDIFKCQQVWSGGQRGDQSIIFWA